MLTKTTRKKETRANELFEVKVATSKLRLRNPRKTNKIK